MERLFLLLLNMSITAGYIVIAVVLLRLVFKRAPKWLICVLWGLVAVRLVLPVAFESRLSLIPSANTLPQNIITSDTPAVNTGIELLNSTINPIISKSLAPDATDSANPMQVIVFASAIVWVVGVFAMLLYTLISYLRLKRRVCEAVLSEGNVYLCDRIDSPFILGLVKPKIYVPSSVGKEDMRYVLSHERAHLKRRDHLIKPFAFLLLALHWFNPLMWLAYILLCRDIELACDEKVIRQLGEDGRLPYSSALINCSAPKKEIAACPLAFGEVGVKFRIKSVLSYKKPVFWLILAGIIACIAVAVLLLTNPISTELDAKLSVFLDGRIMEQYGQNADENAFCCIDYKVLDVEKSGSQTTVYSIVFYGEYEATWEIVMSRYVHTPAKITASKDGDNYSLVEFWTPDEDNYEQDIRDNFPAKTVDDALDLGRYYSEQSAECMKHAVEYFNDNDYAYKSEHEAYFYSRIYGSARSALFLFPDSRQFVFYISEVDILYKGQLTETEDAIILTCSDTLNEYTFKKYGDSLVFSASESSEMPKHTYYDFYGEQYAVEDGEVFFTNSRIIDFFYADIDGNGVYDIGLLGFGPTSGLYTVTLDIFMNETTGYHQILIPNEHYDLSFSTPADGGIQLQAVTGDTKAETHWFDLSFEDGNMLIFENGERVIWEVWSLS